VSLSSLPSVSTSSQPSRCLIGALALSALCFGSSACSSRPTIDPSATYIIGAGDIAYCGVKVATEAPAASTAALVAANPSAAVFTLGDNAYDSGTIDEYQNCYGPTWGQFVDRTFPTPGNHEYVTPGADGYFSYFGDRAGPSRRGYYSYDIGTWHFVSLNSNVDAVQGSEQETWLRADLTAHRGQRCILAYWHHPVFSSSSVHGNNPWMADIWRTLSEFGTDVILTGHDHGYERFAPQRADATPDPDHGIREFVVGTGGANLYSFASPQPNSEVRIDTTFGVIRFGLKDGQYDWFFVPVDATAAFDSGQALCHPKP
jgi:hypothetical protein